jgi:dethiobiotin synthetase
VAAVFITGAGTDIGKTHVAAALARALIGRGQTVDVLKPLLSGYDAEAPEGCDAAVLLAAIDRQATPAEIARVAPFRYRAPLSPPAAARLEGERIDHDRVLETCRTRIAMTDADWLLIEGAGGVMSPVSDDTTFLDLIQALDLPVILVGGSHLGAISHLLSADEVLRGRGLAPPLLVLSQSPEPSPSFADTLAAVARLAGRRPFAAPRTAEPEADRFAEALAGTLVDSA